MKQSFRISILFPALILLTGACTQKDSSVERIRSGSLINAMNASLADQPVSPEVSPEPGPSPSVSPIAAEDPCPEVPKDGDVKTGAIAFADCMRESLRSGWIVDRAVSYYKAFGMKPGERPLSSLTDDELLAFLNLNAVDPMTALTTHPEIESRLRGGFDSAELDEYSALIKRRRDSLRAGELKIYAAMDARPKLVQKLAAAAKRFEMLEVLHQYAQDLAGVETEKALRPVVRSASLAVHPDPTNLVPLLHPFAVIALLPDDGEELSPLDDARNPYLVIVKALAELGGPEKTVEQAKKDYLNYRDTDNLPLPKHVPPAEDAARVAMIDSGIDYYQYPDLGLFLGDDQRDFADGDEIPWLPALRDYTFWHGSGTSATVLTILAQYVPEVLEQHKLDLSMWKVSSLREILQRPSKVAQYIENRGGAREAIIRAIESEGVKPKIVSISMGFPFQGYVEAIGRQGILLKAPWLWVMAAGNSGAPVEAVKKECFSDVPDEERVSSRILCVGALLPGIVQPKIPQYTDYGSHVDVYAYESYIDLCPNGTSCATPAITAAAAAIAAKFPSLTPEQIRQVIIDAAEERSLEIDFGANDRARDVARKKGETRRTVRFFNPPTMLGRAFELARGKVSAP